MSIYKDNKATKDGRQWYYVVYKKDFKGINKKYKSKRYKTKPEAKAAEAEFILKKNNSSNIHFLIIAKSYFEELYKIRKESTVYSYENIYKNQIEPYVLNWNKPDLITPQIIKSWKDELMKKNLTISYLNKCYNILKNIFDFAMKNNGIDKNPVTIEGPFVAKNETVKNDEEKIRYITYDQFKKLISVIDNITWKTFFIFLYYTGMRKGEVQALTWKDINFITDEIIVNKTLTIKTKENYKITSTKNYINRKVKMNKILKDQLILYKTEMKKYSDFNENWFVFGCGRFMPQITIDRKKHYYFNLAQIPEITIHEFRHSHVSLLINEYVKSGQTDTTKFFVMMSNRMGHSIEVMQRTYMHLFPTIQNEIVDILDNL